ncbi:hypothetical protein TrRE_jg1270 [Triparma retinervis]|uniref:Uncharacterized protein n=1 Tax=Triparma retinervis TaxID=2557542 RepID=A0A9W6Z7X7_9STRA|nr:hypothetical protein TrRE_jg1270 [Triparma retinervis]
MVSDIHTPNPPPLLPAEADLNEDGSEFVSVEEREKLGWMLGREVRGGGATNAAHMGREVQRGPIEGEERAELLTSLVMDVLPFENPKYYSFAYGMGATVMFHDDYKMGLRAMDRMLGWRGPGRVDARMALDYFPTLRTMSLTEKMKDDVENNMGGSILNDSSDLRRSSRRSGSKKRKKRLHKFDTWNYGRNYVGRERGEELAKVCMMGEEWEGILKQTLMAKRRESLQAGGWVDIGDRVSCRWKSKWYPCKVVRVGVEGKIGGRKEQGFDVQWEGIEEEMEDWFANEKEGETWKKL